MDTATFTSLSGLDSVDVAGLAQALSLIPVAEPPRPDSTVPSWWDALLKGVRSSADPDGALRRLVRIAEAASNLRIGDTGAPEPTESLVDLVRNSDEVRRALVALVAASRSIATHLEQNPADIWLLGAPYSPPRSDKAAAAGARSALAGGGSFGERLARLKLYKRTEYMKIAAVDLLGIATVEEVGYALASLAAGVLSAAIDLIADDLGLDRVPAFAVIGMGKLGGAELNYASDIDVVFVAGSEADLDASHRIADRLIEAIGGRTPVETIFRVDVDLRPEGSAGPLVRTLDSYRTYWEKWADTWEFQALIKARPVAGDPVLGEAFLEAAQPFVWPEQRDASEIEAIRRIKIRSESEVSKKSRREVKRGPGGIRDVEFAAQLLQLVHGRTDPTLRERGTLPALAALADGGYVSEADEKALAEAYRFLRTVEHRLQLRDERQVYALPESEDDLRVLARTLGYRDSPESDAVAAFEAAFNSNAAVVRSIHERLFFRPLLEAFASLRPGAVEEAGEIALSLEAAEERLRAFGFRDVERARAGILELTEGISRATRLMNQLLPLLLDWLSDSPDPDLGLTGLRKVIGAVGNSANLVTTFRENPTAAQRLCRVLGTSRVMGELLIRQPEMLSSLAEPAGPAPSQAPGVEIEAERFLSWRRDPVERTEALHRFERREFLRIAERDVIGGAAVEETMRDLSSLGDAMLASALDICLEQESGPEIEFTILGLGSLGGREMNYSSDLDVIFVYDDPGGDTPASADSRRPVERAQAVATRLYGLFSGITADGVGFRIDADLRPEGKAGPLVRSLDSTLQYYQEWAETWEFQSLTRARYVAGSKELAERFLSAVEPLVWPDPFPSERVREIRLMKARIEKERIPSGEDPKFHLKLGPGGLSDVEFAVQLLALRGAASRPDVRHAGTLETLTSLVEAGLIDPENAGRLGDAYVFCNRVRNRLFLIKGRPMDSLPADSLELTRLGESLGYRENPRAELREEYRRVTRRARSAFENVFYDASAQ